MPVTSPGILGSGAPRRPLVAAGGYNPRPLYRDVVLGTPGLGDWWRFGELAGTNAADSKGANAGTYTGGFTLGAGGALASDGNGAVALNGTTGYVALPATVPDFSGAAVTFEGWMKTSDVTQVGQQLYAGYQNAGGFSGWGIIYNLAGSRKIGFYSSVFGSWVESTGTIIDTNYHHVAVTVTAGGAVSFYIDGPAGTATSAAPGVWAGTKVIGATQDGSSSFFKGSLDEMALYAGVLPAGDIAAHRTAGIT